MFYKKYFKRPLDIILSAAALVVLAPIIGATALLVRMKLGSPVIFMQERIGKDEKSFKMYKFRSMSEEKDENGDLLLDNVRLTHFGKTLRSTSLDELPALINVLKGEMSLIGPRPLPILYQPYFNIRERIRHSVLGGLSGLAQVNGRNSLNWDERFELDVLYAENISFFEDSRLILLTLKKIFKRENIGIRGIDSPEDFNIYRIKQFNLKEKETIQ